MDKNKLLHALEVDRQYEKELVQELSFIRKKISSLQQKISQSDKSSTHEMFGADSHNGYNQDSAWVGKITFILNNERRFLHAREIQEMILIYEPNTNKEQLGNRVSSSLGKLKEDGIITNIKVNNNNHSVYWGVKEWLENGVPKKEHMYKRAYLVEFKAKKRIVN